MPTFQNPDGSFNNETGGLPATVIQPTTGDTITMAWNQRVIYIANAAALATLTVKLPAKPVNGDLVEIGSQSTVTALTIKDYTGTAITGIGVASLEPGASLVLKYVVSNQFAGVTGWKPWNVVAGLTETPVNYVAISSTATATPTAAQLAGGSAMTVLAMTGTMSGDSTITLPTVALLLAALPETAKGQTFVLRVINRSSANHVWTVATATGWTLAGTLTIAQNTWRDFVVTITSVASATATLQAVGIGTDS